MARKCFGQLGHVVGNADRLGDVAEGVLGDDLVACLAQNQADRRLVIRMAEQIIDYRQVKIDLAGKLGLKGNHLDVDDDVRPKLQVIEQQVDVKVVAADFEVHLAADEGESDAEFEKEITNMLQQTALQLTFLGVVCEGEKVKIIWILKDVLGEVRLRRWEGALRIGESLALPEVEAGIDVVIENGPAPAVFEALAGIPNAPRLGP